MQFLQALPDNKVEEYEKLCLESFVKIENDCMKCVLPECKNVVSFTSKKLAFECNICKLFNCVMCKATHPLIPCKIYQEKRRTASANPAIRNELKAMEVILIRK